MYNITKGVFMAFRSNEKPNKSKLNISNDKLFESVRKRAYELYCKRGYKNGHDMHDWLEAERQVKREFGLSR